MGRLLCNYIFFLSPLPASPQGGRLGFKVLNRITSHFSSKLSYISSHYITEPRNPLNQSHLSRSPLAANEEGSLTAVLVPYYTFWFSSFPIPLISSFSTIFLSHFLLKLISERSPVTCKLSKSLAFWLVSTTLTCLVHLMLLTASPTLNSLFFRFPWQCTLHPFLSPSTILSPFFFLPPLSVSILSSTFVGEKIKV